MEEKIFTIKVTEKQLDTMYGALLELPAKIAMPILETVKKQYLEQVTSEETTVEEENKTE